MMTGLCVPDTMENGISYNVDGYKEQLLDRLGGLADTLLLKASRITAPLPPKPGIEKAALEKELDFYLGRGYITNPLSFYSFPEKIPIYTIPRTEPYYGGRYELISFQSTYETVCHLISDRFNSYTDNKTAYLARWTHGDTNRKTVILLHGYMMGDPMKAVTMFHIKKLFKQGVDVALFIAPFHWRRAPKSHFRQGLFPQPGDPAMTCECFGQSMQDLYVSCRILQDLGSGDIGLAGASLGGYMAGLFSCLSNIPDFCTLIGPAVEFSQSFILLSSIFPSGTDTSLAEKAKKVWALNSLLNFSPLLPADKILIIASRGDRLYPFRSIIKLCQNWGWPVHQFLAGGHWLIFDKRLRGRTWYSFLRKKKFIL